MPASFRRWLPAIPYPHYMAFAPLDVWLRMLLSPRARIHPRYWLRLAWGLFTSALGTAITLPERMLLAPVLWSRRRRYSDDRDSGAAASANDIAERSRPPGVVVILGYYRSGTTHLHYLLSCDHRFTTPKWHQALAPHGFVISWTLLRWLLVPFISGKRPQDDVAIGPEWPTEDDFALNNAALASTMPGRMTLPGMWNYYRRWNGLESLGERELARIRNAMLDFTWRIGALRPGRRVLYKTPSHTARVAELDRLFGRGRTGDGGAKFIHIARDPGAVLKSNVAMHERFEPYFLQDHPGDEEIRRRIVEEYDATERKFLVEAAAIPTGRISRMRYQDLIADPMTELRRVYEELGLGWTPELASRLVTYLHTVKDYRAASDSTSGERVGAKGQPLETAPREKSDPRSATIPPALEWMTEAFGHSRPVLPNAALPPLPATHARPAGSVVATITALLVALVCAVAWLVVARLTRDRLDWFVWPVGVAIGVSALRAAGAGTLRLGFLAGVLTMAVWLSIAYPATYLSCNDYWRRAPVPWGDVWLSTRDGLLATNNLVWVGLGVMSAYRFASRKHVRPPGL